ncbi:helix-turn-helix domain-containing protein [Kribbella sp. NBC_01245]|uniref:ArsR/SmtB family transcription factor n=1 Tax=Kribbella sp. NBC_01245 TaxID=2903578 RepID=UPI002E2BF242|nr:helix-turn-helix domain-containing protein [Kribbella sp. NBC_01245]
MGTVRIHFTSADLARTHIAAEPDPLWEMMCSLHLLQGEKPQSYSEWRRTLPRGPEGERFRHLIRTTLAPAAPRGAYFPDFMTPIEGLAGFEAGLEAVLSTPRRRMRRELELVTPLRGSAGWIASLARGDAADIATLGAAMQTYYERALLPYWPTIRARVRAEYLLRSRLYADDGVTGLLASLRPKLRWEPPVLELSGPVTREVHLNGRGLTLIPSYFNWHNPMLMYDPELPPIVIYPSGRFGSLPPGSPPGKALADLLGTTRAATLRAVADGCTTTELAARTGVSRSTASEHAGVLRSAGLITTQRQGLSVWHTPTALGAHLLSAGHPTP